MLCCRTTSAGEVQLRCSECPTTYRQPQSCGHRSCPQCQNHETSLWLDRQQSKLLPVEYFMITFTLPYELRKLARYNQKVIYNILFATAASTLKDFGLNAKHLGAELGLTAVLHTHSRRLDYHPHLHVIVPGGGVNKAKRQWKKIKGKYLFNGAALSKVFRARFLFAIKRRNIKRSKGKTFYGEYYNTSYPRAFEEPEITDFYRVMPRNCCPWCSLCCG